MPARAQLPRRHRPAAVTAAPARLPLALSLAVCAAIPATRVAAQSTPPAVQQTPAAAAPTNPDFATALWTRGTLLGDAGGVRTALGTLGITLNAQETSELLGNVTGGVQRGASYDGLTQISLALDTAKAFGWPGGTLNVSAFQIHGRSLSSDNLDTIQTASSIEASRATRLWELWYDQSLFDGRADIKLGQQSLDNEFIGSQGAGLFINTMMGWPVVPSYDLYAGGPAYPLSSLGVRLRGQLTGNLTALAGVFDDNPPGGAFNNDSQLRGAEQSGAKFNLNTGALIIAELQYALNQPGIGQMRRPGETPGLPGTYKLGGWFDTARFPDQRLDTTGASLASPQSNGDPRLHAHNWSLYATADQVIWRPDPEAPRSLGVFTRIMGAPSDRNLINFGLNAGLTLKAPLPGRDSDSFGIGYGLATVSSAAAALDRDIAATTAAYSPSPGSESFIELTYQYQAAGWWIVQPDFQYVFTPSGGIADPNDPGHRVGNEAVFGVRTNIIF